MLTETDATRDALVVQMDDYRRLSGWYAARGDARHAALAAWVADLRAVQALMWEPETTDAEARSQQVLAVAGAVEAALLRRGTDGGGTVRGVVESAREALVASFDESVHAQLRAVLGDLAHLDRAPAPTVGAANASVAHRLGGRGGEELVGDLLGAAADCRAVARVMAEIGDEEEQRRQDTNADLAAFEAYLVLASAAAGDATLATTDLRWDLASLKVAEDSGDVLDTAVLRAAMSDVLAPAELDAMDGMLGLGQPPRVR